LWGVFFCVIERKKRRKKEKRQQHTTRKKESLRFLVFNKTNAEEEMFSKNHSKVIYYQ